MEQKEFVKVIQSFRNRLNMAGMLRNAVSALVIGAGAGILFQAVAFVIPFYYASLYTLLSLLAALLTAIVVTFVKRVTMAQTALVMDSFGFEERIVTAYEQLGQTGDMIALQRRDAMEQLALHRDRIRISLLPSGKKTALLFGLLAVMSVLSLLPSAVKERAQQLHQISGEAGEKTKEIEEIMDSLGQLGQEGLAQEQRETLQEMMESLQTSLSEYEQASTAEMLAAASDKLEYKYQNMGSQLASLAQSLRDGASVSPVTAESMQAMAEKLQEMGGMELAMGDGSNNGQNGNGDQNGQNGQSGNGGQNGNGSQNGNNGQNGDNSQNGQNGQGGNGSSDAQGDGRGTGSQSTPHDYVSIPNEIADSGNLTGNAVNHDASEYFRGQNGLGWEGTHMSHEAVIGSYEQNAYEGIAAGRYPSGMEEVIKQYFSSFNQ